MKTYEEFLDEWVCTDRDTKQFMRREDYYKKHIPNSNPRDYYNQLLSCKTFTQESQS